MKLRSFWHSLRFGAVLSAALTISSSAQTQSVQPAISLDPSTVLQSQSASLNPVKGEASFANAPANFYAFRSAQMGEPSSVEEIRLRFATATTLTSIASTKDFPIEDGGSCVKGRSYAKGDTCIVLVRFTPQGAGRRLGTLTVSHAGSAQPDNVGLGGYGYAPVISFTPAVIGTVPGTYPGSKGLLTSAPNLTVSGGDDLYIADTGNDLIRKIDSSSNIVNISPDFAPPASIAVDTFGDIWDLTVSGQTYYFNLFSPFGSQTGFGSTYVDSTCTASAPCSFSSVGMDVPAQLNIDSYNNLFMEEATQGALEMPVGGWSGGNETLSLWHLSEEFAYLLGVPATFGIDPNDNLYTAISYSAGQVCWIFEEPLYGAEENSPTFTRVAGANSCGFTGDGGQARNAEIGASIGQIAFDVAGNMYFSDSANQRVRRIDYSTGIISTIAGNGTAGYTGDGNQATTAELSSPTGVAVDSQGQVYIISGAAATGTAQVVRKLGPNGFLAFGTQTQGVATAAHIVSVSNTGNSTMTLTKEVITGNNPADFTIDGKTTTCVLTAGTTLNAGQHCQIGVIFTPNGTGNRSASLTLLDNTVASSNTVHLNGVGAAAAVALTPHPLAFPSTTRNQTATVPVTVTNSGNAALTISAISVGGANPKMFTYTSSCGAGPIAPKATCKLQVSFKPTSTGSYSALVKVTDNAPDSPQSLPLTGTSVAPASSLTRLASSANPASGCSPVSLTVTVIADGSGVPTGAVELKKNGVVLATAKLSNGTAAFTATGLAVGSNLLIAGYEGDGLHAPSASAPFAQVVQPGQSCKVFKPLSAATTLPTARP
jgi:hypothetical protein